MGRYRVEVRVVDTHKIPASVQEFSVEKDDPHLALENAQHFLADKRYDLLQAEPQVVKIPKGRRSA